MKAYPVIQWNSLVKDLASPPLCFHLRQENDATIASGLSIVGSLDEQMQSHFEYSAPKQEQDIFDAYASSAHDHDQKYLNAYKQLYGIPCVGFTRVQAAVFSSMKSLHWRACVRLSLSSGRSEEPVALAEYGPLTTEQWMQNGLRLADAQALAKETWHDPSAANARLERSLSIRLHAKSMIRVLLTLTNGDLGGVLEYLKNRAHKQACTDLQEVNASDEDLKEVEEIAMTRRTIEAYNRIIEIVRHRETDAQVFNFMQTLMKTPVMIFMEPVE